MFAERLGALLGVVVETHGLGFGVMMFLPLHLEVDHVARDDVRDENDKVVHAGQGFALGGDVRDSDVFEYGEFFFLTSHVL